MVGQNVGLLSEFQKFGQVRTIQKPDGQYIEVVITPQSVKNVIMESSDPKLANFIDIRSENGNFVVSVKLV